MEIRLLADHRTNLVAERTCHQNRLRWHLVELDAELEAALPTRGLNRFCWQDRIDRALKKLHGARVRVARDELRRIRELTRAERELERDLGRVIAALHPDLLAERGCGVLTAAILIGRTAGVARFPTDGDFARRTGQLRPPRPRPPQPRRRPPAQRVLGTDTIFPARAERAGDSVSTRAGQLQTATRIGRR